MTSRKTESKINAKASTFVATARMASKAVQQSFAGAFAPQRNYLYAVA